MWENAMMMMMMMLMLFSAALRRSQQKTMGSRSRPNRRNKMQGKNRDNAENISIVVMGEYIWVEKQSDRERESS